VLLDPQTVLLASWEFEEMKPLSTNKK
jgi:hypothetical protein